ncbi:MAG: DUF2066 domain-containing protein [Dongiaceae bacterium]
MADGLRRIWRKACFLAVLALAAGVTAGPAPALAQAVLYTVSDVQADVTAASAVEARDAAILLAQRSAFEKLLRQLADENAIGSVPNLSNDQISDLVEDFDVVSERTSTVRYIGKFNFRFRGEPVRRLLEQSGVRYAVLQSPPVLVIPVYTVGNEARLWGEQNPWLTAWQNHPTTGSLVPMRLPLGDLADMGAIDAADALGGNIQKLMPLAQRYSAESVVVAEAKPVLDAAGTPTGLAISVQRFDATGEIGRFTDEVPAGTGGADALYDGAIEKVSGALQAGWKQQNLLSSSVAQRLPVLVPIQGYRDWIELRHRLGSINTIQQVEVRSLRVDQAALDLVYVGDRMQLEQALRARSLALLDQGGATMLLPSGASTTP